MTTTPPPEALQLAARLDKGPWLLSNKNAEEAAALLRTQHEALQRKDALLRQALGFLDRYIQEVPLGHQPHMMALDALTFVEMAKKELQ